MQDNMKWPWEQKSQQKNIISPTHIIVLPFLDDTTITEEKKYQKLFAIKNQVQNSMQTNPLYLTESDHCFISDVIKLRDANEYTREIIVDESCK